MLKLSTSFSEFKSESEARLLALAFDEALEVNVAGSWFADESELNVFSVFNVEDLDWAVFSLGGLDSGDSW